MMKDLPRIRTEGGEWILLAQGGSVAPGAMGFVSRLRTTFGDSLQNALSRDLLRLGQTVFLADRCFRRRTALGCRTRTIDVLVPVSNRARWSRLAREVEDILSFSSLDHWRVEFAAGADRTGGSRIRPLSLDTPSVNLFSEGLDSLCGAAAALTRGESPILVSHSPPGLSTVKARARDLASQLANGSQEIHFANLHFRADQKTKEGNKSLFPERSRLSRPFFYLSLAGAVAIELGIDRINLNENGFLSYNLPISPSRHGVDVTRHSHPKLLRDFGALLRRLLPERDWQVANPFYDMTKGEELVHLRSALHLAQETVSCPAARQQMSTYVGRLRKAGFTLADPPRECGICTACIVRRAALLAGGAKEKATHYAFDTPADLNKKKHRKVQQLFSSIHSDYEDILSFARRMKEMRKVDFVVEFLPDLSFGAEMSRIREESVRLWNLCRRAADELLNYYSEMSK